ncbi:MAG: hypothetical protein QM496_18230, partial [Verrucomicrobiota bacterium]
MKSTFLTGSIEADSDSTQPASQPWWLYANLCSLDAPVVAVVWLWAFSKAFDSPVAFPVYTVLFLAVWSIYIFDRLIDGWRQKDWQTATRRHVFARQHQQFFILLLAVMLPIAAVFTLTFLPLDLIVTGSILAVLVWLYFAAFVRLFPRLKPLRAKEFACGLVFAGGVALGVDAMRHEAFVHPAEVLPPVLLFASLCVLNCLLISAREKHSDQKNDPGAASSWWRNINRDLLFLTSALFFISGSFGIFEDFSPIYTAIFISSLLLTVLHLRQN